MRQPGRDLPAPAKHLAAGACWPLILIKANVCMSEIEIWKDIPGCENYLISNYGNVISKERAILKAGKSYILKAKIIKLQVLKSGYVNVVLYINGSYVNKPIHRVVCQVFNERIHNKNYVNHLDGNKQNNYYKNLQWCTCSENHKHAFDTGLHIPYDRHGENHPWVKFSDNDIVNIRALYNNGKSRENIISIYSISRNYLNKVLRGDYR